jgi:hypothetical protein
LALVAAACAALAASHESKAPALVPAIHFSDVTAVSGLDFQHSYGDRRLDNIIEGTGTGVCVFDYNNDGYLDVYFPNGKWTEGVSSPGDRDRKEKLKNHLFRNSGNGTFTDVTEQAGVGGSEYSIGCAAADYDNDGNVDLLVLNYGRNELFHNDGNGRFTEVGAKAGLAGAHFSLSTVWYDYNNDGYLDLYVGNYVEYDASKSRGYDPAAGYPGPLTYRGQSNLLYRNNGDSTFADVTKAMGVWKPEGRAILLKNETQAANHWITITPRLKFPTGARDAYGARVTVVANGLRMIEDMIPTRGYLSAGDPRLNFGLGPADQADLIEIRWPDGQVEQFKDVRGDRCVTYTHEANARRPRGRR